jgi:hypothetical protein
MQGFSNKFKDFPDYILGITKEIWEDRGLGPSMKDYYHPDCVIRVPGGISQGEKGMTQATMETLNEFPDRTLLGEDVIWSGTPEDGMLSSHRILSTATHLGHGYFGAPTGRKVQIRALADCYAKDNMISDEWLIRDNGALIKQLGFDMMDWCRAKVEDGAKPFTPDVDYDGPYLGRGNDNAWGGQLEDTLKRIMQADFSLIPHAFDRASHNEFPGGVAGHGHEPLDRFWMSLRAALPSAEFKTHHVIGRDDAMMPPRAAVRWSLTGTHDGWGAFGKPTGAKIHVMGNTHAEFGPWGIRRTYTLFDETAVWMQIIAHTG